MKRFIAVFISFCAVGLWGCNDDYFTDGGPLEGQDGVLNVSTMDYLESQSARFDTLTTLIKLCGLEAEVNQPGNTFFAPQDYSIHNYFRLIFPEGAWPQLSQITEEEKQEIAGILRNYIIPGQKIVRSGLSTAYSYSTTLGGQKARFNLIKEDYLGNVNMGAAYIVFSLNVNDVENVIELYQSVTVATSGLQSTNGIIHVLSPNTHIFGFN